MKNSSKILAKERQTDLLPDRELLQEYADHIHERGACSNPERLEFLCRAFTETAHRIARLDPSPTGCMVKGIYIRSLNQDLRARMGILFPEERSREVQNTIKQQRKDLRNLVRSLTELLLA